ncbi:biotin--[acetyl-CoA-carboxylase] ligase [Novosphingobium sp. FKTRR1]|uniref:biotin--[acetyl-CoA-carboxylase] ligase n=1 Tax=Novosphingobium sp. FKTRR1 TaxID=2879118 RepID=UPI001CEFB602|nr:biotin--[acetyl-CoA-carboxylase] ligase [Novosphingobium sp. FKTRR1]
MIETVPEIGSTNAALLARLASGDAPGEGDWLVADRQVSGRGRAGRVWTDGFGNFMGSTIVHLQSSDPPPQTLSLVAGVALHDTVAAHCPGLADLALKWPNDLLAGGAKLAGILLERQGDAVVVGIGVNLAQAPDVPGRSTAALAELGFPIARDAFAQLLDQRWQLALARWHSGDWSGLRADWLAAAHPVGTLLSAHDHDHGQVTGAFAGIDPFGVALLRLADGKVHAIHAGDLEHVRD